MMAATYAVSAETIVCVPGDDVSAKFLAANNGDIIELSSEGTYLWTQRVDITVPKTITLRAAAGLLNRPVLKLQVSADILFMIFYNLGTSSGVVSFEGIEIDGNLQSGSLIAIKCSTGFNTDVVMNNCLVRNLLNATTLSSTTCFTYSNLGSGNMNPNSLTVTNSVFLFNGQGVMAASGVGRPKNVTFTNCYFKGHYVKTIANSSAQLVDLYLLDHCTFDSNNSMDVSLWGNAEIKNCIFANSTSTGSSSTANAFGTGGNMMTKCGLFYEGAANKAFPNAIIDATTLRTNPLLDFNGFATAPEYLAAGTDGESIGFYEANGLTLLTGLKTVVKDVPLVVMQNGTEFVVKGVSNAKCSIFNIGGQLVAKTEVKDGALKFAASKGGVYFLHINDKVLKFSVK